MITGDVHAMGAISALGIGVESEGAKVIVMLRQINTKLKKAIRGVETVRFNPFPDQGSNQSFAIGMLSEEGNGVVMSSLYSR